MADEKGLTFFNEVGNQMAMSPEAQAEVDAFAAKGIGEEAKGLPITLPRLTIVHTGVAQFRNETDGDMYKSFNGVIVHVEQQRVWWKNKFGSAPKGEKTLPECFSRDLDAPDRDSKEPQSPKCGTCKQAQWGTDIKPDGTPGKGQACKENRRLFVMIEGHSAPYWIPIPPSSLKSLGAYFLLLRDKKLGRPQEVVTRFALKNVDNADGIKYSELELSFVGKLPPGFVYLAIQEKKEIEQMVKTAAPLSKEEFEGKPASESAA